MVGSVSALPTSALPACGAMECAIVAAHLRDVNTTMETAVTWSYALFACETTLIVIHPATTKLALTMEANVQ